MIVTVYIAEDESLLRRAIIKMIERVHSQFKVVGEAGDGEKALEDIKSINPDILFTDIKMPVMDGIKLLCELKKSSITLIPIILSGYGDFNYAREALKTGVMDYLLKPMTDEVLEPLLQDLYIRVFNSKKEKAAGILKNVLNRSITTIPPVLKYKNYTYIVICAGSHRTFTASSFSPSNDFWFNFPLEQTIDQYLCDRYDFWVMDGEFKNEKIVIFASDNGFGDDFHELCKQVHSSVASSSIPVTTISGDIINDLSIMQLHIQNSMVQLNKRIVFGKSRILLAGDSEDKYSAEKSASLAGLSEIFSRYIKHTQSSLYKKELYDLLNLCKEQSYPQIILERLIKHLINNFISHIEAISQDEILDINMKTNELLNNALNYENLNEGLNNIVDSLFILLTCPHDSGINNELLMKSLDDYIRTNYLSNINLQTISDKFHLTASYISYLYKKEKGTTPTKQITNLRIEKAKELLESSNNMFLKEISEAVGFEDPFYFSRVFKSITGKSPSEYKSSKTNSICATQGK